MTMFPHGPTLEPAPVPTVSLDTLGLYCPVPILKTARKMKELAIGDVLEVVSDDPVILQDMPAWCRSNGQEYLGERAGFEGREGSLSSALPRVQGIPRSTPRLHLFVRKIR